MVTKDEEEISVADNPEKHRYEVRLDGDLAGFAEYRRHPDRIIFTHTEIDPAFEGHGLGGRLAKAALDSARSQGLRVVPKCPFIAAYIEKHPDYADLVSP